MASTLAIGLGIAAAAFLVCLLSSLMFATLAYPVGGRNHKANFIFHRDAQASLLCEDTQEGQAHLDKHTTRVALSQG